MTFPIDDPNTTTPAMAARVENLVRELANIDTLLDFAQAEPQLFGGYDLGLHVKVRAALEALAPDQPVKRLIGQDAASIVPWRRAGMHLV